MHAKIYRFALALLAALGISLALPQAAVAYDFSGDYFYNSAIADGNITICFEGGTPVYTNRSTISLGVQYWNTAVELTLTSTGGCDGSSDPSNIRVWWEDYSFFGDSCLGGQPGDVIAWRIRHGGGYSHTNIYFNSDCDGLFHWGVSTPVPDNRYDAQSVAAHEAGHAYGLDHSTNPYADMMDLGGPYGFGFYGWRCYLSDYDEDSIAARYPGLTPKPGVPDNSASACSG